MPSRLKNEVSALLREFRLDPVSGEATANFAFPGDFAGFRGHFPGEPVVPAICQVQCVLSLLEKVRGCAVLLRGIVRGRFLNTVVPDEQITVVVSSAGGIGDGLVDVRAGIYKGQFEAKVPVSRLQMKCEIRK